MAKDKKEQIIKAHAKFIRLSPRKARLVVNEVRGLKALDAQAYLKLMPQKAAREVSKVINSAMSNAEHNLGISKNDLVIKEIKADQGPTFKRYKPRARGSADTIRRKMTHLSVELVSTTGKKVEKREVPKPTVTKAESKKPVKEEAKKVEDTAKKETSAKKESKKEDEKKVPAKKVEKKVHATPKPKAKKKFEPKQDHSFMGGIKKFFRRKDQ